MSVMKELCDEIERLEIIRTGLLQELSDTVEALSKLRVRVDPKLIRDIETNATILDVLLSIRERSGEYKNRITKREPYIKMNWNNVGDIFYRQGVKLEVDKTIEGTCGCGLWE